MGDLQESKMKVLYHISGHILWWYSLKFRPYIGLIYGRYLQFRFLKWPLNLRTTILVTCLVGHPLFFGWSSVQTDLVAMIKTYDMNYPDGLIIYIVVGGWPTPLKNMIGSVGIMILPNWMESHKIPWFQSPPTSDGLIMTYLYISLHLFFMDWKDWFS